MTGLPSYRYPSNDRENPAFDGVAFRQQWFRHVGSVHRHWSTGELVLFYSTDRHPADRERLRRQLEAHPGNVAAVLAAVDKVHAEVNAMIEAANRRHFVGAEARP